MPDTLRFVDFAYSKSGGSAGGVMLDISDGIAYCLDELEFPPSKPTFEYRDSAHGDGRDVSRYKHPNRDIKLSLHIFGTTEADLYKNARALWANLMADFPILEWQPSKAADPLYIDLISPPTQIDPASWFETWIRDNQLCVIPSIVLTLEAKPFLRAPEESLNILVGLGPNDSFERGTTGAGANFDNWTEAKTGNGVLPAGNTTAGQYLDGGVSCQLATAGGGAGTSTITDEDYLIVDETHHHALQVYCYNVSGAPTLGVDLMCYDDTNALLGTLHPLATYAGIATTWIEAMELGGSVVINPSTSGLAMRFPVGTTKVQRLVAMASTVASVMCVDKLFFGDTEFIAGYKPNGAVGIVVPPEYTLGDVPALADLYFTPLANPTSSGVAWLAQNSGIVTALNAVTAYAADKVWAVGDGGKVRKFSGVAWAGQTNALATALRAVATPDGAKVWAVGDGGVIRYTADGGATAWGAQTYPVLPLSQFTDPGFETIVGGNWTYWTVAQTANCTVGPDSSQKHSGTYSASMTMATPGYLGSGSVTEVVKLAVCPGASYTIKSWQRLHFVGWYLNNTAGTDMIVFAYDSSNTLIGTYGSVLYNSDHPDTWEQISYTTPVLPSNAAYITVQCYAQVEPLGVGSTTAFWFDDITIALATAPPAPALYGVHAIATNNIITVGQWGRIVKSADGATWTEKTSGVTATLRAVHAFDATHILAVGDNGTILTSADGTTWTKQWSGTTNPLYGCFALDATHYWAVGYHGNIMFSGDAGVTWTSQTSGTGVTLRSVYAYNSTHVWAVGDNGTVLFFNGTTWTAMASGTSNGLYGVRGISTTSVWAVGGAGTVLHTVVVSTTGAPFTNLIMGQRPRYSATYDPVKDAVGTTLINLYTRRNQKYRKMVNTGTLFEEFAFNLADHEGRYAVTAALSWAASTTHDNAIVIYKLETLAGTDITTDVQTESVDMGNPTATWKEVALVSPKWSVINLPSMQVGDSASKGNILQIIKVIQDAADDQDEWLDYCAIVPIDGPYVEVANWTANTMILDSSMGLVIASLDGSQDTGQVFSRANIKGFPQFTCNPEGINMTLIQLKAVTADYHANDFCNIVMRYSPLYLLVGEA